jgi:hypothetical protein
MPPHFVASQESIKKRYLSPMIQNSRTAFDITVLKYHFWGDEVDGVYFCSYDINDIPT